jgi:RNA 2',3'-cyclic 3'-phosphodiesterase
LARLYDASSQDVADYLSVRGYYPTRVFTAERFVLFSSRASTGGGPYVVEDSYALSA